METTGLLRAGELGEAACPKSFTPTAWGPGVSRSRLGRHGPTTAYLRFKQKRSDNQSTFQTRTSHAC